MSTKRKCSAIALLLAAAVACTTGEGAPYALPFA